MKFLLVPLVALLALFRPSYADTIHRVEQSVLRLTNTAGTCTGFVVARNRVLTAQHCVGEDFRANGYPVAAVRVDELLDLAVLDVAATQPPLRFREDRVEPFEELTAIGYAFGLPMPMALSVRALIVGIAPVPSMTPGLLVQEESIGGMSGGPMVDHEGQVVAMVQRGNSGTGYGVMVDAMREFLGRDFTK